MASNPFVPPIGLTRRDLLKVGALTPLASVACQSPRMEPNRPDENLDLVLMPGMVFTIKPRIPIKGVAAPAAQVGDPVLVTETGAERLGRRQLDVITLGS